MVCPRPSTLAAPDQKRQRTAAVQDALRGLGASEGAPGLDEGGADNSHDVGGVGEVSAEGVAFFVVHFGCRANTVLLDVAGALQLNHGASRPPSSISFAVDRRCCRFTLFGMTSAIRPFTIGCPANRIPLLCLLCLASALAGARAQDAWESLPDVPFTYGVSAGGGLATDGTYLYAADFSGDASTDYVDLDHNGAYSAGERFSTLGIKTGSVRMARFDPATGSWVALPTLNAAGVDGNAYSGGKCYFVSSPPYRNPEPRYREKETSEIGIFDVARTFDQLYGEPEIVVSQRFYQHCLKHKIPLEVRPVRIDPD